MTNQQVYDKVFADVLAALQRGVIPWRRPWVPGAGPTTPVNAVKGAPYHGGNVLVLWAAQMARGYASRGWLTFKQAVDLGAVVRKGERGTPVYYFNTVDRKVTAPDGSDDVERFFLAKCYTVFNLDQLDDLKEGSVARIRARIEGITSQDPDELIAECDELVNASGANVQHGFDHACYVPDRDVIQMPARSQFSSTSGYYGVLFHELTHWTGHKARLNRLTNDRFGGPQYALEELVAELGAAMLGGRYGVDTVDQSAGYIAHWQKRLAADDGAKVLAQCAALAGKAADYLTEMVAA